MGSVVNHYSEYDLTVQDDSLIDKGDDHETGNDHAINDDVEQCMNVLDESAPSLMLSTGSVSSDETEEVRFARSNNSLDHANISSTNEEDGFSYFGEDGRPSNATLLSTAFISFMSFSLVQLFFAFLAGSQAMKGDSAAMIVDSTTYLFNWLAEKRKAKFDSDYTEILASNDDDLSIDEIEHLERVRKRTRRKLFLKLEIIPPSISVSTLMIVTIVVMKETIQVLILDRSRDTSEQSDPNVGLMMGFSVFNLLLDILNVGCFARAKHLMGFETKDEGYDPAGTLCEGDEAVGVPSAIDDDDQHDEEERNRSFSRQLDTEAMEEAEEANLNMCSAYTHVFADTLRSLAVILAALVALLSESVTAEEADAGAAIAVSILIFLSLIPLIQGLLNSIVELKKIWAEEEDEGSSTGLSLPSTRILD